jgi:predicted DCC family thiol-disulfide oxidoreductase YuxK
MKLLLIYDGTCAYCRGFARLVRALDLRKRFVLLPFESEQAQKLLRAQFGKDFGFAMFLFEEDSVSWGSEAAKRIVQALSLPGSSVAFWLYPKIVQMVSWLTRRPKRVCGPDCAGLHKASQTQSLPLKSEVCRMLKS